MTVEAANAPRASLPAPTLGPRVAARRRRRRLSLVEALVAVALLAIVAAATYQRPPAPLDASHLWLTKAGPSLTALSVAVAHASADPTDQATLGELTAAVQKARTVGPPPGQLPAIQWQKAINYSTQAVEDPTARTQLLNAAGLALVAVEVEARSG